MPFRHFVVESPVIPHDIPIIVEKNLQDMNECGILKGKARNTLQRISRDGILRIV